MVTEIYLITKSYPKEEIYGLCNQLRRAALSIPSNIAEGAGRFSRKEFIQYLYIAAGSLAELETQLIISKNLNYLNELKLNKFEDKIKLIRSQIFGLIKSLRIQSNKINSSENKFTLSKE